jgi:cytochrome c biogenesis protein CcmG/thiol:disulfide interchange protein DsbE
MSRTQPEGAPARDGSPAGRAPRRWVALLPLIAFAGLGLLLFARLYAGDPSLIPSALIGHNAPALDLPGLDGAVGLADADLRQGHVSVVNVFATWCAPCHAEHQNLVALAGDADLKGKGVAIYGLAQKDDAEDIRRFLGAMGNPYSRIGLDSDGRASIDWGVTGVPETYIVKGDGRIAYKYIGPITAETLGAVIKPEIVKAME